MKTKRKLPATTKQQKAEDTLPQICNSTKCIDQRKFIIQHLIKHPCSTDYFRKKGISAPAPRINELRNKGNIIETHYIEDYDSANVRHSGMGLYVLKKLAKS